MPWQSEASASSCLLAASSSTQAASRTGRALSAAESDTMLRERLGAVRFVTLFGMTELASQLYDASPAPVGPRGERAKASNGWVSPLVRDPMTLGPRSSGFGLLEVCDLAIL